MLIRSQDKEKLVNSQSIYLNSYENGFFYIKDATTGLPLGNYETKGRAIEVIDEIQEKAFKNLEISLGSVGWVNPNYSPIYVMPQK